MALRFFFGSTPEIVTNLGHSFDFDRKKAQLYAETHGIQFIQADGDELEHIQTRFANLPYAHRICTWRGEMARFILDNL